MSVLFAQSILFFFKSETPTYGNKAEYDNPTQKPTSRKNTGRIFIISARSAISLALVLIILHELVAYRQMSPQINVHQIVNDVYDDICDVERVAWCYIDPFKVKIILISITDWQLIISD